MNAARKIKEIIDLIDIELERLTIIMRRDLRMRRRYAGGAVVLPNRQMLELLFEAKLKTLPKEKTFRDIQAALQSLEITRSQ